MPTALPHPRVPRAPLTARQAARLLWLTACSGYLLCRMVRLTQRPGSNGSARSDGRLLHFSRRWVAREEEIAALLQVPVPDDVRQVRAIFVERPADRLEAARQSEPFSGDPRSLCN